MGPLFAGRRLLQMDVIENLPDHVRLGDRALKRVAITRNWPPHFGHSSMSSLKTRLSLSAQESGARGRSVTSNASIPILGHSRLSNQIPVVGLIGI